MVVVLLLSLAALGQAPATSAPEWREYASPDGAFTILMPGPAEVEEEMREAPDGGGSFPMRTVSTKVDNSVYLVISLDYPPAFLDRDPRVILNDVQELAFAKSKAARAEKVRLGEYPGRDLRYETRNAEAPKGWLSCRERIYLAGERLYHLTYASYEGNEEADQVERWMDSFKLLPHEKHRPVHERMSLADRLEDVIIPLLLVLTGVFALLVSSRKIGTKPGANDKADQWHERWDGRFRKAGFLLLALGAFLFLITVAGSHERPGPAIVPAHEWREYASPDGRFSIMMPGRVEIENAVKETPDGAVPTITVTARVGNSTYRILTEEIPPASLNRDPQTVLDQVQARVLGKARVLQTDRIRLVEFPGRDLRFESRDEGTSNGQLSHHVRVYLAEGRLCSLTWESQDANEETDQVERWMYSFKLWPPGSRRSAAFVPTPFSVDDRMVNYRLGLGMVVPGVLALLVSYRIIGTEPGDTSQAGRWLERWDGPLRKGGVVLVVIGVFLCMTAVL
jgi:hypothetical protein